MLLALRVSNLPPQTAFPLLFSVYLHVITEIWVGNIPHSPAEHLEEELGFYVWVGLNRRRGSESAASAMETCSGQLSSEGSDASVHINLQTWPTRRKENKIGHQSFISS